MAIKEKIDIVEKHVGYENDQIVPKIQDVQD